MSVVCGELPVATLARAAMTMAKAFLLMDAELSAGHRLPVAWTNCLTSACDDEATDDQSGGFDKITAHLLARVDHLQRELVRLDGYVLGLHQRNQHLRYQNHLLQRSHRPVAPSPMVIAPREA